MQYKLLHTTCLLNLLLILGFSVPLFSQNCENDSTGLIPITDLESGFYEGFQGGLYFGSNHKPIQQVNNVNNAISKISPLNASGITDLDNGRIVLLSIGASNPKTEFESFQKITETCSLINPYLTIVNGCEGGNGLQQINHPTNDYWSYVSNQLSSSGVNNLQVQVIWIEQENTSSQNYNFPSAPLDLMNDFKTLFKLLLQTYPNLQICYLNSRGYSGYIDNEATPGYGLRQPRDYFNGWTIKWLIEAQIKGDISLAYNGVKRNAPVLDWGAYLWADGKNSRSDGFKTVCPDDVQPYDGLHWSSLGNNKAGNAVFQKFYTDIEAQKWFLKTEYNTSIDDQQTTYFEIYPNPCNDFFFVKSNYNQLFDIYIYSALGELIKVEKNIRNNQLITSEFQPGIYLVKVKTPIKTFYTAKLVVTG